MQPAYQAHCTVAHASNMGPVLAELGGRQLGPGSTAGDLADDFLNFLHVFEERLLMVLIRVCEERGVKSGRIIFHSTASCH